MLTIIKSLQQTVRMYFRSIAFCKKLQNAYRWINWMQITPYIFKNIYQKYTFKKIIYSCAFFFFWYHVRWLSHIGNHIGYYNFVYGSVNVLWYHSRRFRGHDVLLRPRPVFPAILPCITLKKTIFSWVSHDVTKVFEFPNFNHLIYFGVLFHSM